jgi:hypothetical protein
MYIKILNFSSSAKSKTRRKDPSSYKAHLVVCSLVSVLPFAWKFDTVIRLFDVVDFFVRS